MALNYKSEGIIADANLIIETGATITAGSLIIVDISGTNVVHRIRSYSGVTPESSTPNTGLGVCSLDCQNPGNFTAAFIGVLASTQTGVDSRLGGNQTGVAYYKEGVFEFTKTLTSSSRAIVGHPAYAVRHDVIRCATTGVNASPANATATIPIGVIVGVRSNTGTIETGITQGVFVKLYSNYGIQPTA